jgi:hypothetical protein
MFESTREEVAGGLKKLHEDELHNICAGVLFI